MASDDKLNYSPDKVLQEMNYAVVYARIVLPPRYSIASMLTCKHLDYIAHLLGQGVSTTASTMVLVHHQSLLYFALDEVLVCPRLHIFLG